MTPGHVIAVVGPSGVGKDSVMAGLVAARPELMIARRTITRPEDPDGEQHEALSPEAFDTRVAENAFCLHWTAHGLSYGIPIDIVTRNAQGESFLLNLSRKVLPDAAERFERFTVLHLTARPETLAARLAGRGRETAEDIAARLARDGAQIPRGLNVIEISNDGPLEETVKAALVALQPVSA